jgi:hypothetical protein
MSTRTSLLALAAIATIATAALAATEASAAQFTVNHFGGHFGLHYPYPRICALGCGHWRDHEEDEREHRWSDWGHRPYYGGPVGVAGVASLPPASAQFSAPAPTPSGGCLTKRELPDGSALFRDLCTQEQAESTPQGGVR